MTDAVITNPIGPAGPISSTGSGPGPGRSWRTDLPWWLFAASAPLSVFVAQLAAFGIFLHAVWWWRQNPAPGWAAARRLRGIWIATFLIGLSTLISAIASPAGYMVCANGLAKLSPLLLLPMVATGPPLQPQPPAGHAAQLPAIRRTGPLPGHHAD